MLPCLFCRRTPHFIKLVLLLILFCTTLPVYAQNQKTLSGYWYCLELRQEVVIKRIAPNKYSTQFMSVNVTASTPNSGNVNIASQIFRPKLTPARRIYPKVSSPALVKAISYGLQCQAVLAMTDDNLAIIELAGPDIQTNIFTKKFSGFGAIRRFRWNLVRQDIGIAGMEMSAPSELSVYLSSIPFPKPRSVSVSTTINSKEIKFAQPVTFDALGHGVVKIDLKKYQVPRFKENVKFTVAASAKSLGGSQTSAAKSDLSIPLPIVFVPGIVGPNLHNLIGLDLDKPLTSFDKIRSGLSKLNTKNSVHYTDFTTNTTKPGYYTMFVVSYDRNNGSFASGAQEINRELDLVKYNTYASKCNIVAHSKGCLVTREFVSDNGQYSNADMAKVVYLCQGPNLGSLMSGVHGNQTYKDGTEISYKNLSPVYSWVYDEKEQRYIVPNEYYNDELNTLNQKMLRQSATYVLVYSSSHDTPTFSKHVDPTNPLNVAGVTDAVKKPGDGVVPLFSQLGITVSVNEDGSYAEKSVIPALYGIKFSEKLQIEEKHENIDTSVSLFNDIVRRLTLH